MIWKDVYEYDNYEVSNTGLIRSKKSNKLRKVFISDNGYPVITLSKNNKAKTFKLHRIIANAFIPNPDNKPLINHIDSNKQNYSIENLEWCTSKENSKHAYDSGRINTFRMKTLINSLKKLKEDNNITSAEDLINTLENTLNINCISLINPNNIKI